MVLNATFNNISVILWLKPLIDWTIKIVSVNVLLKLVGNYFCYTNIN